MILVDTSIWVDHFRAADKLLAGLLDNGMVLGHPFIVGELALGNLHRREAVVDALQGLPSVCVATDAEVLRFIDHHALYGRGIGLVDVHLLAGARLTAGAELWTRDRRLHGVAVELGLAFKPHERPNP